MQGRSGETDGSPARTAVGLPWLVRLRWGVFAAQAVAVAMGTAILGSGPPLSRGLALLSLTLASNVALGRPALAARAPRTALCGCALALDTVVLTLLLRDSGGPANPFSVLYLVGISLSDVVLGSRWAWMLTLLAVAGYGSLFLGAGAAPSETRHHSFASHLHGIWVAFVIAAGLTAYFVSQLAGAVERRDREIAAVRERALRYELDASPDRSPVQVAARVRDGRLTFIVEDRGTGMAPDVRERAAEQFFTTKPPGAGLGLGLFLTRTLVEQLGGSLAIESAQGRGTQARLELPLGGQG